MPRTLNRSLINRFFKTLDAQLDRKAYVLLTGAAAGNILGKVRPSNDIDFAVQTAVNDAKSWELVRQAVDKTIKLTGINANYSSDIGRWGMISLMDYLKHTIPYHQFGRIEVEVLAPAYWSIGKMTRYLVQDVRDMVQVFKRQKVGWRDLVKLWAAALRKSPQSTALFQFRKNAENFLQSNGRKIWGKSFSAEEALSAFHQAAGISAD